MTVCSIVLDVDQLPCCSDKERDPLEVTIAATQDNRNLLEEHDANLWAIASEGEGTMVVRFNSSAARTLIYGMLIFNSKQLWAY